MADIARGISRSYGRSARRTHVLALRTHVLVFLVAMLVPAIGALATPAPVAAAHVRSAMPAGWSAGPVQRWTGYAWVASQRVREVQRTLRRLKYRPGPVDGLFGPRTERAVLRFQHAETLRPDGIVGPRTLRRLHARVKPRRTTTEAPKGGARSQPDLHVAPARTPAPPQPVPPQPVSRWAPALGAVAAVVLFLLVLAGALIRRRRDGVAGKATPPEPAAASSRPASGRPQQERPISDVGSRLLTAEIQRATPGPLPRGETVSAPARTQVQQWLRINVPRWPQGLVGWCRWRDAVARLAPGRGRTRSRVVPLSAAVFAEGVSDDPQIGDFAGFVFAMALSAPGSRGGERGDGSRRYRVHDVNRNALLWVREEEIVRTFGTRPVRDGNNARPSRGNAAASPAPARPRGSFARYPSSRRRSDAR